MSMLTFTNMKSFVIIVQQKKLKVSKLPPPT